MNYYINKNETSVSSNSSSFSMELQSLKKKSSCRRMSGTAREIQESRCLPHSPHSLSRGNCPPLRPQQCIRICPPTANSSNRTHQRMGEPIPTLDHLCFPG